MQMRSFRAEPRTNLWTMSRCAKNPHAPRADLENTKPGADFLNGGPQKLHISKQNVGASARRLYRLRKKASLQAGVLPALALECGSASYRFFRIAVQGRNGCANSL
jgi:hypothetical protein